MTGFRDWFAANSKKLRRPWHTDSLQAAWDAGQAQFTQGDALARALAETDPAGPATWAELSESTRDSYRIQASRVLRALKAEES